MPINGIIPAITIALVSSPTLQELAVHLTAAPKANVELSIAFPIQSSSEATTVYSRYTKAITSNVASGNFTRFLQSGGGVLQSALVAIAQFSTFSVKTTSRIQSPTSRPSSTPKVVKKISSASPHDVGLIVGLVVAGLALLAVILFLYYSGKTQKNDVIGKTTKVIPGRDNFLDLETVTAPDGTRKKHEAASQPKRFNAQNIHFDDTVEPIGAIPEIYESESPALFQRVISNSEENVRSKVDEVLENMKFRIRGNGIGSMSKLSDVSEKKP